MGYWSLAPRGFYPPLRLTPALPTPTLDSGVGTVNERFFFLRDNTGLEERVKQDKTSSSVSRMPTVAVLFVHGMSHREKVKHSNEFFAKALAKRMKTHQRHHEQSGRTRMTKDQEHFPDIEAGTFAIASETFVLRTVNYASCLAQSQRKLWSSIGLKAPHREVPYKHLSVGMRYFSDYKFRKRVMLTIREGLASLARQAGPSAPLVIVGHSLGTVVSNDYIRAVREGTVDQYGLSDLSTSSALEKCETLAAYYTLGCPYSWFFPLRARVVKVKYWFNFFFQSDVFAGPLKPLDIAYDRYVTQDISLSPGFSISNWTPMAHLTILWDPNVFRHLASVIHGLSCSDCTYEPTLYTPELDESPLTIVRGRSSSETSSSSTPVFTCIHLEQSHVSMLSKWVAFRRCLATFMLTAGIRSTMTLVKFVYSFIGFISGGFRRFSLLLSWLLSRLSTCT